MNLEQSSFISKIAPAAVASEKATGIPACITIAQAILESGWGKTKLASAYGNFFGIKANQHQIESGQYHEFLTHEEENHNLKTLKQDFAIFPSFFDCFTAHAALLQTPHYCAALAVANNPDEFAYMLGPKTESHPAACDYSTLTDYHDRLMALVREFDLTRFAPAPPTQSE